MNVKGMRVAIAGMGVSGFAIARAVQKLGGEAIVFDQRPADSGAAIQAADDLTSLGVKVVTGWHGRLEPGSYDLYVVSPGFPVTHPSIQDMRGAGKEVIGEIEFAYRITHVPILAITGTNGKSTTTALTYALLKARGLDAVLCGNIAGSGFAEQPLTSAAIDHPDADVLVAEVSSYQLETIKDFKPHVATVLNVTADHMERHSSLEEYREIKFRIASNMSGGDVLVLDSGEPSIDWRDVHVSLNPEASLWLIGSSEPVEELPDNVSYEDFKVEGSEIHLGNVKCSTSDLQIEGPHQYRNAAMAWSLCAAWSPLSELDESSMLAALKDFQGLKNRMELVGQIDDVAIYNNSVATNPDSVIADLDSLTTRQHVLIGGTTKNLKYERLGSELDRRGHLAYVFGPNGDEIASQLGSSAAVFESLEEAFDAALSVSAPGEAIVLSPACASAYPYANFIERAAAFVSHVSSVMSAQGVQK